MTLNIRRIDPLDPKDQKQLADFKKQPGPDRLYLVSQPEPPPGEEPPEDILDDKASTKATLDHLARLIIDQRIDILHCDPGPDRTWVRGRIDGQLQRIGSLPLQNYAELLSYLKIRSGLDLADDVCQTGWVDWSFDNQTIDGQVQTVPTVNGEKLTFRRQLKEIAGNLGAIGFWGLGRRQLEQALGQTRGLILFVSPDPDSRKLCLETAESILGGDQGLGLARLTDQPTAEHDHQTLLKPEWGRTSQQWLKTQASGDNDVLIIDLLAGEISCQLAIEAALNNKLVLAGLPGQKPQDATEAITSQKIDPHLLTAARPTLVASRLVRRLKPRPKPKKRPGPAEWLASTVWDRFGFNSQPEAVEQLVDQAAQAATEIGGQLDKPAKNEPQDTDYRGRILLTEVWADTDRGKTGSNRPVVDLSRDGLIKICLGLTSPTEVEQAVANRRI